MAEKRKVAFVYSGAAALIAEELALTKALMEGNYPGANHTKDDPLLPDEIAGTSSGAICSVFMDGIIKNAKGKGGLTWTTLEDDILFPFRNEDVYETDFLLQGGGIKNIHTFFDMLGNMNDIREGFFDHLKNMVEKKGDFNLKGIVEDAWNDYKKLHNKSWDIISDKMKLVKSIPDIPNDFSAMANLLESVKNGYLLDTAPLIKTLQKYVNNSKYLGLDIFDDLEVPTTISTAEDKGGALRTFHSKDKRDGKLDIVELLMGSSALPGIFPKREISDLGFFLDGGTRDVVPVEYLIRDIEENHKKKFEEVYVICPKIDVVLGTLKHQYTEIPLLSNMLFGFQLSFWSAAPYQMHVAKQLVEDEDKAFVYMPTYKKSYNFFNFNNMKAQYDDTTKWAKDNAPMTINEFLGKHECDSHVFGKMLKTLMDSMKDAKKDPKKDPKK